MTDKVRATWLAIRAALPTRKTYFRSLHREVAPILRDLGRWGQVIGGRQLPFALFERKKLYSNVNYIRVRSFILGGAPLTGKTGHLCTELFLPNERGIEGVGRLCVPKTLSGLVERRIG
jgi:hypothetical protein